MSGHYRHVSMALRNSKNAITMTLLYYEIDMVLLSVPFACNCQEHPARNSVLVLIIVLPHSGAIIQPVCSGLTLLLCARVLCTGLSKPSKEDLRMKQ